LVLNIDAKLHFINDYIILKNLGNLL
jgi:hypothetical protein